MKAHEQERIRCQLDAVQRWRASGQSKDEWALAHGMDAKQLMGWITHEGRWRARLSGGHAMPPSKPSQGPIPVPNSSKKSMRADRESLYAQWDLPLGDALQQEWPRGRERIPDALDGAAQFAAGQGRHGQF